MRLRRVFCALLLSAGLFGAAASAEQLVTIEVESPPASEGQTGEKERYTFWLGEERLREDRKNRSMIVDRAAGKLYVIKHADKTYHALDLPIDFEAMVPASMLVQWRSVLAATKPQVTIAATGATDTIRGHAVKNYAAEIAVPRSVTTRLDIWASTSPGFDYRAFNSLMVEIHALQPGAADWIKTLFETVEGYPVKLVRTAELPDGPRVWTEHLVSVDDKRAPDANWTPDEGYTEVEFNLLSAAPR